MEVGDVVKREEDLRVFIFYFKKKKGSIKVVGLWWELNCLIYMKGLYSILKYCYCDEDGLFVLLFILEG